jgi:hypothetical protein
LFVRLAVTKIEQKLQYEYKKESERGLKSPKSHQRELVDGSDPTYKQRRPQLL